MNEKRTPHFPLAQIKAAFPLPAALNRTTSAFDGAAAINMDDADVIAVLQALTSRDFDKSMTSHRDATVWQDVYKPWWEGTRLYVKLTLDTQGDLLLISFKET